MFDPGPGPRVFGLPPGADFPQGLLIGLVERMGVQPPEALARVEIYVNTRRMQRRIKALFDAGPARLLPRIRLITDLASDLRFADVPPPVPALRRRLELTQLIGGLLDKQPDLAPRAALFDLADSLAKLMDEMQGEGVAPDVIRHLDVTDISGHWQRSLRFVNLVEHYFGAESTHDLDAEARQRLVIERLKADWQINPPTHPVLVAGSTGSRGATGLFMQAVAQLPQGAVILPGVDFDMPARVWDRLDDAMSVEDHPQFRFARLAHDLGMHPKDIVPWTAQAQPPCPARNKLVSLALRPAPVTDQWLSEGSDLRDLASATQDIALIEAASPRAEATAIALVLRNAAEQGRSAALITPDRTLTRQVTAALDRWGIVPDDSAGRPLPLSAPGRFLRHVAALFGRKLTAEALLTILKHPLTNTGSGERGAHLLHTRELELNLRKWGPPFPTGADIVDWAAKGDDDRRTWAIWLSGLLTGLDLIRSRSLVDHVTHHIDLAEALAGGPGATDAGELWCEAAGQEAGRWVEELRRESAHGGNLSVSDYEALFHSVLQRGEVREAVVAHPGIMIWGTLEARVQGADMVVLSGLNEGVWPEPPKPDPWLNRALRHRAGLLLPERQIGLAAHDFQQAIAVGQVILTRAVRDSDAQTVPSRWLNRLTNLLGGLAEDGEKALTDMRARGAEWLALAERLDSPVAKCEPAPRPSPSPPLDKRPKEISITEVRTLIRDPYAVYARRVLGLTALDPLRREPDAPLRGTVLHKIVERFIDAGPIHDAATGRADLMAIADDVLGTEAVWPATRRLWRARIAKVADWFIAGEITRQQDRRPVGLERKARILLPDVDVHLRGKIDRVDQMHDGRLAIYDYKTGLIPTRDQQQYFDKQLMLAAILAEHGALDGIARAEVAEVAYIGLGATPKFEPKVLDRDDIGETYDSLVRLLHSYQTTSIGYTSRRAVELRGFTGDYDHLARFGEWDETSDAVRQELGA